MSGELVNAACPRCGGGFACGANAGHCDCFELRLSERLRERIAREHPGACLCLRCLKQLAAEQAGGEAPAVATD